ncbi:MAG: hypothetical protein KAR03_12065 [Candidatus Thorarchaeota archaeon]|nr:hypothetical protein [Candidatus Thorarchaeota archaeon]
MGSFMRRFRLKRRYPITVLLLSAVVIVSVLVIHPQYLGIGFVADTGGFCFVSEPYGPNDNVSYTVNFHNVEFKFLLWYYPPGVSDYHYTVYFNITFEDGTTETLTIATGSWWYTGGGLNRPLSGVTTTHTSPTAGVLKGDYLDNPPRWQFTVSIT